MEGGLERIRQDGNARNVLTNIQHVYARCNFVQLMDFSQLSLKENSY